MRQTRQAAGLLNDPITVSVSPVGQTVELTEQSVCHVGKADKRAWGELELGLKRYAVASASEDEQRIKRARAYVLAAKKDEVLDRLFGLRQLNVPYKQLDAAYELAVQHEDQHGDPTSAWGFASGLTRLSQASLYTSARTDLDRAAGKVLALVE